MMIGMSYLFVYISCLHYLAVVEKERHPLIGVHEIEYGGHPVITVIGKQVHPFLEPAFVQKARLAVEKFFDVGVHANGPWSAFAAHVVDPGKLLVAGVRFRGAAPFE